ncbi:MAG: hypothetical protein MUF59_04570 [Candidatus Krumholzibacteria bacterium]|jgi:hypothetical protein|nr:hypothetical protein [Candidatus Krumholzibacteria bacterium]
MISRKPDLSRLATSVRDLILIAALAIILPSCGESSRPVYESGGPLSPDERYIVQLYVKINDLEKNLQDNPSDSLKLRAEFRAGVDSARVVRILGELEKKPERWFSVYSRINELLGHEK